MKCKNPTCSNHADSGEDREYCLECWQVLNNYGAENAHLD